MGSRTRTDFRKKFRRTPEQEKLVYQNILQSQQIDVNGELADTLLVCNGGTIRAHGFLLQQASPFIQICLASQGENYPFTREIILPDFSVQVMQNLLGLIYKGFVNVRNESEKKEVQDALHFFQVSGVDCKKTKFGGIGRSLKVQPCNRIPPEIFVVNTEKQDDDRQCPTVIPENGNKDESLATSSKTKRVKGSGTKLGNGDIKEKNVTKAEKQQQVTKVNKAIKGAATTTTPVQKTSKKEEDVVYDVSSGDEEFEEQPRTPSKPQLATIAHVLIQRRTRHPSAPSSLTFTDSGSASEKRPSKSARTKNPLQTDSSTMDDNLGLLKVDKPSTSQPTPGKRQVPPPQQNSCRKLFSASKKSLTSNQDTESVASSAKKAKTEYAVAEKRRGKKSQFK